MGVIKMETYEILLMVAFIVVAAAAIAFFIYKMMKTKPQKEPKKDYSEIVNLFGKDNIINIERTEQRVRIEVKDLNLVLLEQLKPYTNGVFTIGNKVVVTFKEKTEEVIKSLEGMIK